MKRIVSLLAAAALVAATLVVVVPLASAHTAATTIKVTAKDFSFTLSKKSATHGKVTFKLTNKGHTQHDFKIAGKKTPKIGPGKSATLTVTLKKGKKYAYLCTVPGHAQLGMKGSFKAT